MRRAVIGAAVVLGALAGAVRADDGLVPSVFPQTPAPPPRTPGTPAPFPGQAAPPKAPTAEPQPKKSDAAQPDRDAADRLRDQFSQPTEQGGVAARSANENFDGDFGGVFYSRTVLAGITTVPQVVGFTPRVVQNQVVTVGPGGQKIVTTTPVVVQDPIVVQTPVGITRVVRLPLAARYNGVLVTDNDNPRPTDRVYFGYTYYDRFGASLNPGIGGSNLNREMVGFERTFLGGDASFGMRLPVIQQFGPAGLSTQAIGDLTLLSKFVLLGDRRTGNLWSAGMALTTPTGGGGAQLIDGINAPHSWLFQPWTGFVWIAGRGYAQGIASGLVPTDSRDPTLINNSLAFGYQVYRGSPQNTLSSITPAAEVHVRTPLNHRDPNGMVYVPDQVSVTTAVHIRASRLVFSPAINVPLTGPKPWAVEAMAYLNWVF